MASLSDFAVTFRWDPELAPLIPHLPVPGPAEPTSGVAEAVASRELAAAFLAEQEARVTDTEGVSFEDVEVPGTEGAPAVLIRLHRPERLEATPSPAVLHIHGGGFAMGSVREQGGAALLAKELGVVVADVEYRLAPEHPALAAVEDCYAALQWLHREAASFDVDVDRIVVVGASAGGGIAAGLALYARDRGGPSIAFQCLMIPQLDDRLETPSMRQFAETPLWNRHAAEQSWRWYLGGAQGEAVSPYASPARAADLAGLPPAYVSVMEYDPLRDEGIHYALRLLEAGVSVELHAFPGTFHGSAMVAQDAAVSRREHVERLSVLRRALGLDGVSSA
jgi:acetyl esterase